MRMHRPTIVRGDSGWAWIPRFYLNRGAPTWTYWMSDGTVQTPTTIRCDRLSHSWGFIWGTWGFWPVRWSTPNRIPAQS